MTPSPASSAAAGRALAEARRARDETFHRVAATHGEHEAARAVARAAGHSGTEAERVAREYLAMRNRPAA